MKSLVNKSAFFLANIKKASSIAICSAQKHDFEVFTEANKNLQEKDKFKITYFQKPSSLDLVKTFKGQGFNTICGFVNDDFSKPVLEECKKNGIDVVALRCAGFDKLDLKTLKELKMRAVRVPAYAPQGVAEHAMGLVLALNRNIHKAYWRVLGGNYSIEGLMGIQFYNRTVGIIGSGRIGICFAKICKGFGMKILINDAAQIPKKVLDEIGAKQVSLQECLKQADLVSIHTPLTPQTKYLINKKTLAQMKKGALLVNVARGPIVKNEDVIEAIKSKHLGGFAADVLDGEGPWYFTDHSQNIVTHDSLCRLVQFPNVLLVAHQGALFREAHQEISKTTLQNVMDIRYKGQCKNEVK